MLQYKKDRFGWGQVTIKIPEGFYWNKEPDVEMQDGLFLLSPDKNFSSNILIYDDVAESAYEELMSTINDFTILEPITEITVKGFCGYHAMYCTRTERCYEAQLDIPGGVVDIIIKSGKGNIFEIKQQIDLNEIIDSVL